jgi:hypothetical protein
LLVVYSLPPHEAAERYFCLPRRITNYGLLFMEAYALQDKVIHNSDKDREFEERNLKLKELEKSKLTVL